MVNKGIVGQRVKAAKDLLEEQTDGLIPAHYVARCGDILVIRKVRGHYGRGWAYHVSREEMVDRIFGVSEAEINTIPEQQGVAK